MVRPTQALIKGNRKMIPQKSSILSGNCVWALHLDPSEEWEISFSDDLLCSKKFSSENPPREFPLLMISKHLHKYSLSVSNCPLENNERKKMVFGRGFLIYLHMPMGEESKVRARLLWEKITCLERKPAKTSYWFIKFYEQVEFSLSHTLDTRNQKIFVCLSLGRELKECFTNS